MEKKGMMNMNNEKLRVAIYIRIGNYDKQEKEKQKKELQEYCKKNNYTPDKYYIDNGYSANDENRPSYNQLLEEIKQNRYDLILTKDFSRITRSITDLYDFENLINKKKCQLKTLQSNQEVLPLLNPFQATYYKLRK
ncbi:MAG: recombinase family protein [Bacilli bacterium]|nr:recombinase family protein [Bacilli bacterium]